MECQSDAELIACAILETQVPTQFQIIAYVIVPLVLGIATFLVAIASLAIAIASNKRARYSEQLNKNLLQKQKTLELSNSVFEWCTMTYKGDVLTLPEIIASNKELHVVSLALVNSDIPGSKLLQELLWKVRHQDYPGFQVFKDSEFRHMIAITFLGRLLTDLIHLSVINWVHMDLEAFEEYLTDAENQVLLAFEESIDYAKRYKLS